MSISKKPKVLICSDDAISPINASGVGRQARFIIEALINNGFEVCQASISTLHPSKTPPSIIYHNSKADIKTVYCGKGDDNMIDTEPFMQLFMEEKPDVVLLFQDPGFFLKLFHEQIQVIKKTAAVVWCTIWDTYLTGGCTHYNLWMYQDCDVLSCISRQTEWFINEVFKFNHPSIKKPIITYCGHGQNPNVFKPLKPEEYQEVKTGLFNGQEFDFVGLMVNNNQNRKNQPNLIMAWNEFNKALPVEAAKKTALIIHGPPISNIGTDLYQVAKALGNQSNIFLSANKMPDQALNQLYNLSDVVINISNAEGFGLTCLEGILSGRPVLINGTGGLVDQAGYVDESGIRIPWTKEFKEHLADYRPGCWAYVTPNQLDVIGSPATPYLYDENPSIDDVKKGLLHWYNLDKEKRNAMGLQGREWLIKEGFTHDVFANRMVTDIKTALANFKPSEMFTLHPI